MIRLSAVLAAICFLAGSQCLAHAAPMKLYFLADGNVRFDAGPELDAHQLRSQIQRLKRQHPRPEIRLVTTKNTPFEQIGKVVLEFKRAGYRSRVGFTVNQN